MSKQINFTIVPEDPQDPERGRRQYANFCAVAHTPFDLTLTFCDVRPLSERDIKGAEGCLRPMLDRLIMFRHLELPVSIT